jgi:hypothetical protein
MPLVVGADRAEVGMEAPWRPWRLEYDNEMGYLPPFKYIRYMKISKEL